MMLPAEQPLVRRSVSGVEVSEEGWTEAKKRY